MISRASGNAIISFYWTVLDGIPWYWMVLDGTGWYWMVLNGIQWFWNTFTLFKIT